MSLLRTKRIQAVLANDTLTATQKRDELAKFDAIAASIFEQSHSHTLHFEATKAQRAQATEDAKWKAREIAEATKAQKKATARIEELRAQAQESGKMGHAMMTLLAEQALAPDLYFERMSEDDEPPTAA